MAEVIKPHLRDFLLFVGVIIFVIIGTIFMFSRNNSNNKSTKIENSEKIETTKSSEPVNTANQKYNTAPEMKINPDKKYFADIKTNTGDIEVELFAKENPITVNNFVFLSKEKFYDGTIFHRIVKNFMIQGGDPIGTGTGGPGYKFNDEKITRDYKRGIMAMANSGPNTNGSQFFIMLKDTPLPKNYVIFGTVVKGIETVDKIAETETVDNGYGEQSKPTKEIKIETIGIREQ
jgi:cyclophilin family peptidyl-prolyl cis-trans isomerase